MRYSIAVQRAIKFSIKTHEIYQKQKRKGKDVAYITHPLTVGLILSLVDAKESVVIAGLLHDTIEDSVKEKKVDAAMIKARFGAEVTKLVLSVTEQDQSLPWAVRKREAIEHIKDFSEDSLLLKSADILANTRDIIDDYMRIGDEVFSRFSASKELTIRHYLNVIKELYKYWPANPISTDLKFVARELKKMR